jgi:hypothetical protein
MFMTLAGRSEAGGVLVVTDQSIWWDLHRGMDATVQVTPIFKRAQQYICPFIY